MSRRSTPERRPPLNRLSNSPSPVREPRITDSSDCEEECRERERLLRERVQKAQSQPQTSNLLYLGLIAILACALGGLFYVNQAEAEANTKLPSLKPLIKKYKTQDEELWLYVQSGLKEIKSMDRPRTLMFLYTDESSHTMHKLLSELGEYATCYLTSCEQTPIVLNYLELNTKEYMLDYGKLISQYKPLLQKKGVMIVRNIERVNAEPAKAFHVFCDEFTPLVEKSMIIFTMKVAEFHGDDNLQYLEDYFRKKWEEIDVDAFYALFTRIATVIIEIKP